MYPWRQTARLKTVYHTKSVHTMFFYWSWKVKHRVFAFSLEWREHICLRLQKNSLNVSVAVGWTVIWKRILFCARFFSFSVTWFWNIITFSHWHMFSSDGLSVGKELIRWENLSVRGTVYFVSLSYPFPHPISSNLSLQVSLPVSACKECSRCVWDSVRSAHDCRAKSNWWELFRVAA